MTYYVEHPKAIRELEEFLKRGKGCIRCLSILSGVLSGLIPLDALMRHMEPTAIMAAIVIATIFFGIFGILFSYGLMGSMLRKTKKRYGSKITLSETDAILTDGVGEIIKQVSYQEIECIEIQYMYSTIVVGEKNLGGYYDFYTRYEGQTDELIPFICLHIKYMPIPYGSHRKYYNNTDNVLFFPYQESAWDLLSKQLPDKIISNTELQSGNIV